jgi:phosphocarrier protein FPr/phosphocarrier protein
MSQGISHGDVITVTARGRDSRQALEAVVAHLEPLELNEAELEERLRPAATIHMKKRQVAVLADGAVIRAQPASPGLSMGAAFTLQAWDTPTQENPGTPAEEQELLAAALKAVRNHLQELSAGDDVIGAEIAVAHLALLDDPVITDVANALLESGHGASRAWHDSINESVEKLQKVDDKRMRERVDDLKDMNLRVQRALAGFDPGQGPELPEQSILIAENLLPSQLLELEHDRVAGICTAAGGTTSHVAILALSLEIPMLVAAGDKALCIEKGDHLLLDGEFGELKVRPDKTDSDQFEKRIAEDGNRRQAERAAAHEECRTRDDTRIHFNANLASAQDAEAAVQAGAEGCGLLRTEFVFMGRAQAPGADQQLEIYQQISDILQERPLVVRTLDAVMIPMVTSVHEVIEVREIIDSLCQSRSIENTISLGVMIETPAAALIADRLACLVDFFSIGTNDLTQYTLSMDRGEPRLATQLDTLHPAVLGLIRTTVDAADKAGIPVAVCGGAAGDMMIAPVLLGLGIRKLSMPQSLIARQKARLRELSISDCISLADAALAMNSARDVRAMMRDFYGS